MKKFIESMRIYNGEAFRIELHQRRFDLTRLAHYGMLSTVDLNAEVNAFLARQPAEILQGLSKLRITYRDKIEMIEIEPYARRRINAVAFVEAIDIDYRFKYADRSALELLRVQVPVGVEPIIVQNGLVTDAIYANVCLYDGVRWLTPERPLLEGVARTVAIAAGEITPAKITTRDVEQGRYTKIRLINCMNLFKETAEISL